MINGEFLYTPFAILGQNNKCNLFWWITIALYSICSTFILARAKQDNFFCTLKNYFMWTGRSTCGLFVHSLCTAHISTVCMFRLFFDCFKSIGTCHSLLPPLVHPKTANTITSIVIIISWNQFWTNIHPLLYHNVLIKKQTDPKHRTNQRALWIITDPILPQIFII